MSELTFVERPERQQQAAAELRVVPGKYLSITSFKRDGSGVATPVWFVQEGGRLLADPLPAQAELLPDAEVGRVERLLVAKYRIDLLFIRPIRAMQARLRRRRPRPEPIIVALTPG